MVILRWSFREWQEEVFRPLHKLGRLDLPPCLISRPPKLLLYTIRPARQLPRTTSVFGGFLFAGEALADCRFSEGLIGSTLLD
jgi:hypothetical protein